MTDVPTTGEETTPTDGLPGLFDSAPDAMLVVADAGEIVLVNKQAEKLFGYSREELLGQRVEILVPDRLRDRHRAHRSDYSSDPRVRQMGAGLETYGQRKNGSEFPVEISLAPLHTEHGTLVVSAIRDVTEQKRTEREASHFRAVVESSHDAIISHDLEGLITSWNAGAERLHGYRASEVLGKPISILVPPSHKDELSAVLSRVRSGRQVEDFDTVRLRKEGNQVDVSLTVSPIRDHHGNVVGASTIARDIRARLRYQEQLEFLAEHDALTGVLNRRRFEREVSDQVARARRYGEQAALLLIDIDGFKQINDTYGHRAGDQALKTIAAALRRRLRNTDVLARVGGDEFAILMPYADAGLGAAAIVVGLRRVIVASRVHDRPEVHLSASIGVVKIDSDTPNAETVLVEVDRLMYADKRRTRNDDS